MNALPGFGLVFLVVGGLALLSGARLIVRRSRLMRRAVKVRAKVINLREGTGTEDGPPVFHPFVAFQARGGETVQVELLASYPGERVSVGDRLPIVYDPDNPRDRRSVLTPDRVWGDVFGVLLIGGLFFAVGVVLYWVMLGGG